jgi:heme-degrading monooxygenase HmoA
MMGAMDTPEFQTIWEFRVPEGARDEFASHYGPEGSWAHLFARGEGYLGTELLQDATDPERFLTIDHWLSQDDFETFKTRFAEEYAALDARCEALTAGERAIGQFFTP